MMRSQLAIAWMWSMIDNLDVAVLSKVNSLAERYGFKPYDFVATFQQVEAPEGTHWKLAFESFPGGDVSREATFDRMLKSIGIDDNGPAVLHGSAQAIFDALDHALDKAPKSRGRV
jgi:hypothetical protein